MTASTTDLRVDLEAPIAVKSHSMARSTSVGMGRSWWRAPRARAHVKHERQFRAALVRVAGAVPRGAMTSAKAWLMAAMVTGVAPARRSIMGS
jgi:hypothetical protein